jgi:crotonobetainyl-CoA:carnitine CoA-transferase CaiB-like acyl-CoA transferase
MMLGDQGADVIKVEPPGGDLVRNLGPNRGGLTASFVSSNRSKRSLVLDLKSGRGNVRFEASDPDRRRVRAELPSPAPSNGWGWARAWCAACATTSYTCRSAVSGKTGPYAHKRVYDPVIQALSGLAAIQADRDTGRPRMVRTIIPDKTTALTAAQAITAALFARERTGRGQHVKIAMLDAMVAYLWPEGMTSLTFVGREVQASRAQIAQDLIFQTTDGFITAGAVSDAEWLGMCTALERLDWLDDERFKTAAGRVIYAQERLAMTSEVLRLRSSAEWLERLDREAVPCAPVLSREEVIEHEQIRVNATIEEHDHVVGGRIRQPRPAARFSATPARMRRPAPLLGEQSREILEEAGFAATEIDALLPHSPH